MARIPRYVQDSLASSRVGTPGLDRSAMMEANAYGDLAASQAQQSVAQTDMIGDFIGAAGASVFHAIGNKIKQARAAAAHSKAQYAAAQSDANVAKWDSDIDGLMAMGQRQAQRDFVNSPKQAHKWFSETAPQQLEKRVGELVADGKITAIEAEKLKARGYNTISSKRTELVGWGEKTFNEGIVADAKLKQKEIPLRATDLQSLKDATAESAKYFAGMQKALGPKNAGMMDWQTRHDAARNVLTYTAENKPEQLDAILADPLFQEAKVSTTEVEHAKNTAQTRIHQKEVLTKQELTAQIGELVAANSPVKSVLNSNDLMLDRGTALNVRSQALSAISQYEKLDLKEQARYKPVIDDWRAIEKRAAAQVSAGDSRDRREAAFERSLNNMANAERRRAEADDRRLKADQERLAKEEAKAKMNSPEAVGVKDNIQLVAATLSTKEGRKRLGPQGSINAANALVKTVNEARQAKIVTDDETRHALTVANELLFNKKQQTQQVLAGQPPTSSRRSAANVIATPPTEQQANFLLSANGRNSNDTAAKVAINNRIAANKAKTIENFAIDGKPVKFDPTNDDHVARANNAAYAMTKNALATGRFKLPERAK